MRGFSSFLWYGKHLMKAMLAFNTVLSPSPKALLELSNLSNLITIRNSPGCKSNLNQLSLGQDICRLLDWIQQGPEFLFLSRNLPENHFFFKLALKQDDILYSASGWILEVKEEKGAKKSCFHDSYWLMYQMSQFDWLKVLGSNLMLSVLFQGQ